MPNLRGNLDIVTRTHCSRFYVLYLPKIGLGALWVLSSPLKLLIFQRRLKIGLGAEPTSSENRVGC